MKSGVARAASLDLPQVGSRDLAEEDRLRLGRTVHHDEPRTPDWGRDSATSRGEPRVGSGDFAEEAADIGEAHAEKLRSAALRRPTKPNLDREHAEPLIVGPEAKADASECASCRDFDVGLKARRPNDTKFSGERSESAATRC